MRRLITALLLLAVTLCGCENVTPKFVIQNPNTLNQTLLGGYATDDEEHVYYVDAEAGHIMIYDKASGETVDSGIAAREYGLTVYDGALYFISEENIYFPSVITLEGLLDGSGIPKVIDYDEPEKMDAAAPYFTVFGDLIYYRQVYTNVITTDTDGKNAVLYADADNIIVGYEDGVYYYITRAVEKDGLKKTVRLESLEYIDGRFDKRRTNVLCRLDAYSFLHSKAVRPGFIEMPVIAGGYVYYVYRGGAASYEGLDGFDPNDYVLTGQTNGGLYRVRLKKNAEPELLCTADDFGEAKFIKLMAVTPSGVYVHTGTDSGSRDTYREGIYRLPDAERIRDYDADGIYFIGNTDGELWTIEDGVPIRVE